MSWGTTESGITETQRKVFCALARVREARADHLARAFGVNKASTLQHLRNLRSKGVVEMRRVKNVGWWSVVGFEDDYAARMKKHAFTSKKKGGMGERPTYFTPKANGDRLCDETVRRRAAMVRLIKKHQPAHISVIAAEFGEITANELSRMVVNGMVHRPSKGFYAIGPAE